MVIAAKMYHDRKVSLIKDDAKVTHSVRWEHFDTTNT